ncbi:MAG: hypothetical protein GXY42_06590 [Desulfovibrionales bacterium]|nr:hypothetical protein [Desulfovibrionales bacterium]
MTKTRKHKVMPVEAIERIIAAMPQPPKVEHNPAEAFYSIGLDTVSVPPANQFDSAEEYYSTLFHELVHSTGHDSRLQRPSLSRIAQGSDHLYSYEELVAEMGAAMLCGLTGIAPKTIDNSAAYIANWLQSLRDNPDYVIYAGAAAQKACRYIKGERNRARKSNR